MNASASVKSQPLWRTSVIMFAIVGGLLLAGEKVVDSIVTNKFLLSGDNVDKITSVSSYLVVGSLFAVVVSALLALVLGNKLHYLSPINLWQPKVFLPVFGAAFGGVAFTAIFLYGLQYLDLQLMYALTCSYILFTIAFEWIMGKLRWRAPLALRPFILPGLVVFLGSVLATFSTHWLEHSAGLTPTRFVVLCIAVFVVYNGFFAMDQLCRKPAVDKADPMNVMLLRAIFFAAISIPAILITSWLRGTLPGLQEAIKYLIGNFWAWICLLVLFCIVTGEIVAQLIAQKMSNNVSNVVLVVTGHLALGLPLSVALNAIWPGAAGKMPSEPIEWAVRVVGAVVILTGVIGLFLLRKPKKK